MSAHDGQSAFEPGGDIYGSRNLDIAGDTTLSGAVNLPDGSLSGDELADGGVDTDKIADDAVDGTKLADDSVDSEHLADDAVGPDQLDEAGDYIVNDLHTNGDLTTNDCVQYLNTFWEDEVIDATRVNLTGPAAAPAYNATEQTIDFSASAVNTIQINYQMKHGRKEGTDVHFHTHAMPETTNTGNVAWECKHRWLNNEDVAGAWTTATLTEAMSGTAKKTAILSAFTIDGTGKEISSILQVQLQRLGNDGADTFTGLVQMMSADVHYQKDAPGSEAEYVKFPA